MSQKMIIQEPIQVEGANITKRDSFESGVPSMGFRDDKAQQPVDDGLVASVRTSFRVDTERIQKIWQEMASRRENQPSRLQKRQISMTSMNINRQASEVEKKKVQFGNVSEKCQQHLTSLIQIYKFRNNNRFSIDATEKIRSDLKERIVTYLLYAIEELREVHNDLSSKEQTVVGLDDQAAIAYARKIAVETEFSLIRFFNKDLRGKIERNYKDRANTILVNIRDENNLELRRKVINGTIEPNKLANIDEIELFTQARRDEIHAKARQEMAQAQTTISTLQPNIQLDEITYTYVKQPQSKVEKPVEQKPKSLDEKITKQLRELMKKQILEFKQKITDDLPETQANCLTENLKEVFVKEYNV